MEATCREALFNLGLVYKKMEHMHKAMEAFVKLHAILKNSSHVISTWPTFMTRWITLTKPQSGKLHLVIADTRHVNSTKKLTAIINYKFVYYVPIASISPNLFLNPCNVDLVHVLTRH